jgi:hypothetical protein
LWIKPRPVNLDFSRGRQGNFPLSLGHHRDAFRLTAIEGLAGADAALKLGMAVAHVFVAKHRVQKMLQEEVRLLKRDED